MCAEPKDRQAEEPASWGGGQRGAEAARYAADGGDDGVADMQGSGWHRGG